MLILTGPPGAGKTTTAALLASRAPLGVHLRADAFWEFVVGGFKPPHLPGSQEQNATIMRAIRQAALAYAEGGYFVVIDGIVGPWFVHVFDGLGADYAVLRPSAETAMARATGRAGGEPFDAEPIEVMYRQFANLGEYERHVIDTTGMSPEHVVAELGRRDLQLR